MIEGVLGFLFGSAMGSAICCAAVRSCDHLSWVHGRSTCDGCGRVLPWSSLIPVVSFCLQKGQATCCRKKLSAFYLIVELLGGGLGIYFVFAIMQGEDIWALARLFLIACFALFVIASDGCRMLVSVPMCIVFAGTMLLMPSTDFTVLNRLVAAGAIGAFFFAQYLATKGKGIGTGDIWLGVALGSALGFPLGLIALGLGYVLGAIHAIILLIQKKADRKTHLPLGVYLMMGMIVTVVFAPQLLEWVGI